MIYPENVRKIEDEQDRKYKARKMANRVLRKAWNDYAYTPYRDAMDKLSSGKSLTSEEFNTVKNLAEKYGKPIPSGKLKLIKSALTNPLRLRHFNQFGQELK